MIVRYSVKSSFLSFVNVWNNQINVTTYRGIFVWTSHCPSYLMFCLKFFKPNISENHEINICKEKEIFSDIILNKTKSLSTKASQWVHFTYNNVKVYFWDKKMTVYFVLLSDELICSFHYYSVIKSILGFGSYWILLETILQMNRCRYERLVFQFLSILIRSAIIWIDLTLKAIQFSQW